MIGYGYLYSSQFLLQKWASKYKLEEFVSRNDVLFFLSSLSDAY